MAPAWPVTEPISPLVNTAARAGPDLNRRTINFSNWLKNSVAPHTSTRAANHIKRNIKTADTCKIELYIPAPAKPMDSFSTMSVLMCKGS